MTLAVRAVELEELMDDPACDPKRLRATLRRFEIINRLVSGWGVVYRTRLAPRLAALARPARVLDLGSGGGDLLVRLARLAGRDGLDVEWVGAEPDPRGHEVAVTRDAPANVSFECADAETLLDRGEVFDAVISNHVLHHIGADATAFLARTRALSRGIVLHSDIARSRRAYALYAIGITPFAPGTFLRIDGLRSIRRSFTRDELRNALDRAEPATWRIEAPVAFRLLAVAEGSAGDA